MSEEFQQWLDEYKAEGRIEGRIEGKLEAYVDLIKAGLTTFEALIESGKATPDEIEKIKDALAEN